MVILGWNTKLEKIKILGTNEKFFVDSKERQLSDKHRETCFFCLTGKIYIGPFVLSLLLN